MFGKVIHTGGLVSFLLLGILWVLASISEGKEQTTIKFRWQNTALLPFAILSFWAPYQFRGDTIIPDFDPIRLLYAPDYGMAFCFTAPVFLYLLFALYPGVNIPVYRFTVFNGLLYALFNLNHLFTPSTRWMGDMHIPLLALSTASLLQTRRRKEIHL